MIRNSEYLHSVLGTTPLDACVVVVFSEWRQCLIVMTGYHARDIYFIAMLSSKTINLLNKIVNEIKT